MGTQNLLQKCPLRSDGLQCHLKRVHPECNIFQLFGYCQSHHTFQLSDTEGQLAQQQLQQRPLVIQVACGCMHELLCSLLRGSVGGVVCSFGSGLPPAGCLLYQRLALCQRCMLCQAMLVLLRYFVHLHHHKLSQDVMCFMLADTTTFCRDQRS